MKRLIWIAVILSVLYGGYWFIGRSSILSGADIAVAGMRDDGWTVEMSDLSTRGFPSRFDTTLKDVMVFDPVTRAGWSGEWLQIFALSYRPTEVIALFPRAQKITVGVQEFRLETRDMRASAAVRAAARLPFDRATIEIDTPRLFGPRDAWMISANRILIAARDTRSDSHTYDIFTQAEAMALPADMRRQLDPANTLPATVQLAKVDGTLEFSHSLDRFAADQQLDITAGTLRELVVIWGDVELRGVGNVTSDAAGFASGTVSFSLRNWRKVLTLLVNAGAIDAGSVFTITAMAQNMDATPDDADLLTLSLTMQDGRMAIGTIPLGPAPRLR